MRKIIILLSVLISVTGISCNRAGPSDTGAKKKLTIAVIPKGTTHEFWKSIHAGANKAAEELNGQGVEVSVIWKGPLREDDREQQIQVVEGFVSQGVNGIVLAPLDNHALVRPVEEAKRAGVPTVIIDSGLESTQIGSFVATDNLKGGRAFERQGQGAAAPLHGGIGEHARS
jgi:ribose transport system substrate-binding protein